MFTTNWLRAPCDLPLATRLYQRTYGRTFGRRATDADQPTALPQDLRLSEMLKFVSAQLPATRPAADAGHDIGRAA